MIAAAYVNGVQEGGIGTAIKHFVCVFPTTSSIPLGSLGSLGDGNLQTTDLSLLVATTRRTTARDMTLL
jgi:beta-glucosidase-like glycosyl hydrolase